jgi:hypothetical protein
MADVRCLRCAERYPADRPTLLGEASLIWGYNGTSEVGVVPKRRRGRKELAGRRVRSSVNGVGDDGRMTDNGEGLATTGELSPAFSRRAVKLPCRRCGLPPDVVLERLRPALLAGYPEVLVGANGEVRPMGAPHT